MKKIKMRILISCFVFICTAFSAGLSDAELTVEANHDRIDIDFFYHGSTVGVSGESEAGTDIIVKITSPEGDQTLRKKGKAAGFLWMNVGELTFKNTPDLYFLRSTREPEQILRAVEMDKYLIGYDSLQKHADIEPADDEQEKGRWFDEFVKYKESLDLYSVSSGNISLTENNGMQNYSTVQDWSFRALPGEYTVTVYEVRDGRVVDTAEKNVVVKQVGIVKMLLEMAKNNGALYGLISILTALGAGFGVGLIFKKGGGAH